MDNKVNFFKQSMDEIVFDCRNKKYGAFVLRETYQKHLLKAIGLTIGIFVFGLYSPKIARAIGLFKDQITVVFHTHPYVVSEVGTLKIENPITQVQEAPKPAEPSIDGKAVKKEDAIETPVIKPEEGTTTITGPATTGSTGPAGQDPFIPPLDTVDAGDFSNSGHIYQAPQFIGGEEALIAFLQTVLVYPQPEKDLGIEGETIVSFVVTIDGKVEDVRVAHSSGNAHFDAEAIKAVKKATSKFKPGKMNNKLIRSTCKIPISFESDDE